ncbi:MAG: alpha/beta hydrolase [Dehalococcoidales bacterium]|nr:alpha/beta hydrolase [Dehalococcoidales bacterium]
MRLILSGLAVLFLVITAAGIIFRENIERHFIYYPDKEAGPEPSNMGLSFEDVTFTAEDGIKLHGWFIPGDTDLTWLWFHGNAGNICHRLENLYLLHNKLGVNIFIFDYRGYGSSQGKPTEKGTYLDAEAAVAWLHSKPGIRKNRIVYFGRSLGTAVAVETAVRHPPAGLILESAFPSIPFVARRLYPYLPVWPFLSTRYDSISKIKQIEAPVLMLHGDKDNIVPLEAGQRLFEAAEGEKSFYVIPGASHNDTYQVGGEPYFLELSRFLISLPEQ